MSPSLLALLHETSAAEFLASDGVAIDDVVDVSAEGSVTHALKAMEEHKLSAVLVSRFVVVSWSATSAVPVTKCVGPWVCWRTRLCPCTACSLACLLVFAHYGVVR